MRTKEWKYKDAEHYYDDPAVARKWDGQFENRMGGWSYRQLRERSRFLTELGGIRKDSVVLSVGCGTGHHEELIECDNLICMDIAGEMLKIVAGKDLPAVRGTVFHLPFPENTFDCVFAVNFSPMHYDDESRTRSLREMRRVVKKGGRIITMTANELHIKMLNLIRYRDPDRDLFRVKNSLMMRLFRENRIEVEKSFSIQYYRICSMKLDRLLARTHLDFLGHWFICCGIKN